MELKAQISNKVSKNIIIFMIVIFIIGSLQSIIKEAVNLRNFWGLSYLEKLDRLDSPYYHRYFYRYYAWIDSILPHDQSFSIMYDESVEKIYGGYRARFNYYFYPRRVLFGKNIDFNQKDERAGGINRDENNIKYSDIILILDMKKMNFKIKGGLKYFELKGKKYYLVSTLDDMGLSVESYFILKNIIYKNEWSKLRNEFKIYYGIDINKAGF